MCPEDLMLGRARAGMKVVQSETGKQLIKRFRVVQETKEELWDRWVKEVFPSLLKQRKWFKYKRNTKVGDVILRKDETAAGQTYKYARIVGVHVRMDGKVRSAKVEYRIPGEAKFRGTTKPKHNLVLVVPVEEQTMDEGEVPEVEEAHLGGQEDLTENAGQALEERSGGWGLAAEDPKGLQVCSGEEEPR